MEEVEDKCSLLRPTAHSVMGDSGKQVGDKHKNMGPKSIELQRLKWETSGGQAYNHVAQSTQNWRETSGSHVQNHLAHTSQGRRQIASQRIWSGRQMGDT